MPVLNLLSAAAVGVAALTIPNLPSELSLVPFSERALICAYSNVQFAHTLGLMVEKGTVPADRGMREVTAYADSGAWLDAAFHAGATPKMVNETAERMLKLGDSHLANIMPYCLLQGDVMFAALDDEKQKELLKDALNQLFGTKL